MHLCEKEKEKEKLAKLKKVEFFRINLAKKLRRLI